MAPEVEDSISGADPFELIPKISGLVKSTAWLRHAVCCGHDIGSIVAGAGVGVSCTTHRVHNPLVVITKRIDETVNRSGEELFELIPGVANFAVQLCVSDLGQMRVAQRMIGDVKAPVHRWRFNRRQLPDRFSVTVILCVIALRAHQPWIEIERGGGVVFPQHVGEADVIKISIVPALADSHVMAVWLTHRRLRREAQRWASAVWWRHQGVAIPPLLKLLSTSDRKSSRWSCSRSTGRDLHVEVPRISACVVPVTELSAERRLFPHGYLLMAISSRPSAWKYDWT